jgi:hypothetical protein
MLEEVKENVSCKTTEYKNDVLPDFSRSAGSVI